MKFGTLTHITNLDDCDKKFKRLKDLGFEACQLVYKPDVYTKEAAEIIKESAAKYNIDISAQFAGFKDTETLWYDIRYAYKTLGVGAPAYRMERIKYIKSAIDFASWAGIEDIVIHAGFIPNDLMSPDYADMLVAVETLARHCKTKNMNLLLETGTEAPIVLLSLINDLDSDNVYINFDPANILMYGYGNPVDALHVFGKHIRNMHGKDGMLPTDPHRVGKETPVGKGMVDFPKVFEKFKELGYDRYVIIEREIEESEDRQRDILNARDYLKSLC